MFLNQENEQIISGKYFTTKVLVSFCDKIQLSKISKAEFSSNLVSVLKTTICTANVSRLLRTQEPRTIFVESSKLLIFPLDLSRKDDKFELGDFSADIVLSGPWGPG